MLLLVYWPMVSFLTVRPDRCRAPRHTSCPPRHASVRHVTCAPATSYERLPRHTSVSHVIRVSAASHECPPRHTHARHVIQRMSNPRISSQMASYDVASTICEALPKVDDENSGVAAQVAGGLGDGEFVEVVDGLPRRRLGHANHGLEAGAYTRSLQSST